MRASKLDDDEASEHEIISKAPPKQRHSRLSSPAPLPSLDEVLLTPAQERELERKYLDIKGDTSQVVEIPRNDAFPNLQRTLRSTKLVGHGHVTQRTVDMLASMHCMPHDIDERYGKLLIPQDRERGEAQAERRAKFFRSPLQQHTTPPQVLLEEENSTRRSVGRAGRHLDDVSHLDRILVDISSSDELDDNANIPFEANIGDASSKSSSPPLVEPSKPFSQGGRRSFGSNPDSDADLPDFGTLVRELDSTRGGVPQQCPSDGQVDIGRNRRKGARRVVQDDSDDE